MDPNTKQAGQTTSTIVIPAKPNLKALSLESDYQEFFRDDNRIVNRVQNGTDLATKLFTDAYNAIGKILGSVSSFGVQSIENLPLKSNLMTIGAGFGGIYAGLLSIKNLVKTVSSFTDPKSAGPIPWLIYGLQSVLEGGLAIGLTAPFLNMRNPFAKVINGKEIVQFKTLVAAALTPILLSRVIEIVKNNSIATRIPLIGRPLKEIFGTVFEGIKHISTNTGDQNTAGQAPPAIPGLS